MRGNPKEIDHDLVVRAKQLKGIVIGGGEPVLNLSTKTLLSQLDHEQKVSIHFNGTVLPDQDFLKNCERLQNVKFVFSIDGVQERFEYLRWPAKWDRVVKNIVFLSQTAPTNVEFGVNITISQLNKFYYTEVVEWAQRTIPKNSLGKETVITFNTAHNRLSRDYLDALDKKRQLDWRKLFPLAVDQISN